jgi:two-component system, chemotaxis family, sensor kinase CheA
MRIGLRVKLCVAFIGLAVLAVGVCGALVDRVVKQQGRARTEERLRYEVTMTGQMTASSLFAPLAPGDTSLQAPITELAASVQTHLSLLTPEGHLAADSERAGDLGGDEHAAPEVVQALAHTWGTSVRDYSGQARLWVAQTIVRDQHVLGIARASLPMSAIQAQVEQVRRQVLVAAAMALGIASLLAAGLSLGIARPVRRLALAARQIGEGALGTRVAITTGDEIGELAQALNDMAGKLQAMLTSLDERNTDMRAVLDNVGEGLLTLGRDSTISRERSAVVERWFGPIGETQRFFDYLAPDDPRIALQFDLNWEQLMDGVLPAELCLDQLPRRCETRRRSYDIEYKPILESGAIAKVLVVVRDVTSEIQARRKEEQQRETLAIFERIMRDKNGFLEFLSETETLVRTICGPTRPDLTQLKRALHTLKGNAGVYGVSSVAEMCHALESELAEREGDLTQDERAQLQHAFRAFEERLRELLGEREASSLDVVEDEYEHLLQALLAGSPRTDLADMLTQWRNERVQLRFERFAAQASALAKRLEKGDIQVEISDNRVRLRRDVMAPFWSAFIHVIRNAADHGLVKPEERDGRPGRLRLSASKDRERVRIEVSDDGRGVDWAKLAARAAEQGLPHSTREELVAALFSDGVSTRDAVTEVSGRGTGLAAVRHACEALAGKVSVLSEAGGTTFVFDFPVAAVSERTQWPQPRNSLPQR